ncbi:MAG: Epoxyqueuosine reductase [Verrucomicrobiae bacterium]|nr:Epoxyqueuosine reductase [Verrucomicrobiae bacterium]
MPSNAFTASEIKARARQLGFDLVGITTAAPPPHAGQFQQWLADKFHGEMAYLERNAEKRIAPAKVLADAKSIIVVGLNYYPGKTRHIARYAVSGRDYHDVMTTKLKQLTEFTGGLWYVDTGPILERDLAQRAGIGFIGKHTNLISRQLGNWVFLGAILSPLELPADKPEGEYCGTCRRCMDVCPTRAIVAPYRLDARLCISYLTIELKGSIPVELRPLIGDRVFGCDDCLEVCPWNRFARLAQFQPRELPALTDFLSWDDAKFKSFFAGTPIYRLKRRGFLRNVCVVLGNSGDKAALPALQKALDDPEPLVREHAAWAISRL